MKLCSSCYGPICDFCVHYAFNGDKIEGFKSLECFNGDGFCKLNREDRDPCDECKNFVCRNWQQEKNHDLAGRFVIWNQIDYEALANFDRWSKTRTIP